MNVEEFRVRGKQMVDYICEYMATVGERRVTPDVEPGYLRGLLPERAPEQPEPWDHIMRDVEDKIMPGVTHWQHPRFHAYFPSGNSYPSILGDMLSDAVGCIGFSWAASPACTELETIVLDWLCRALDLPGQFLSAGAGGGALQGSASECVLACMLAARHAALCRLAEDDGGSATDVACDRDHAHLLPSLVAYCSREAHSCVEKAATICLVRLRVLEPDERGSLRGDRLRAAMQEDVRAGLVPFFVSATLGSTACTSFDNLEEIGPACRAAAPHAWLHVDAAYAGNALICPELRPLMRGIQHADSFNTNPNKWLLTNFDCSCMWVKDRYRLTSAMVVDPLYLQHGHSDAAIDYRHWGVPLSRRFRALKLWFVLRSYGCEGLREYVRRHVRLAAAFAAMVRDDARFEVTNEPRLGLVCFRLVRGGDRATQELLALLNAAGRAHMVPAIVRGHYSIRFCVTAERADLEDVQGTWRHVRELATGLLAAVESAAAAVAGTPPKRVRPPPLARLRSRRFSFTRSVSRDLYERSASRTNLYDGATPILVPDDDFDFPLPPCTPEEDEVLNELEEKMRVVVVDK